MAHVLVLHNQPVLPPGHPQAESEAEILYTVEAVDAALLATGHRVSRLGLGNDPGAIVGRVRQVGADVIFNLFEGIPDEGETESCVASLLEWLAIPFTGSPARTLSVARDKPVSKMILHGAGLPTAEFLTVTDWNDPHLESKDLVSPCTGRELRWPLFVKLADQDASVGIDQDSVVTTPSQLRRQTQRLLEHFGGTVIIEEYVSGRELTVGVIAIPTRMALPVSEFEFCSAAEASWPIVTYDAKWNVRSRDYVQTPYRELADVSAELSRLLSELALRTFDVLGLRDYGRIDFRVTPEGRPCILEANPNPDLSPSAGLAGVLAAVGLTYRDLIAGLVSAALGRCRSGFPA